MCESGAERSWILMWDLQACVWCVRVTHHSLHLQRDPPLGFRDLDQHVP